MELSLWERLLWYFGIKPPLQEMALRTFAFIDDNGNGTISITAMELLLKLIQDELPLGKTSFDYLEVGPCCLDSLEPVALGLMDATESVYVYHTHYVCSPVCVKVCTA